jgi:hypothetical protein
MSIIIHQASIAFAKKWVRVNDDRTVTYHVEGAGWTERYAVAPISQTVPAEEAKKRWPAYAPLIDDALAKVQGGP